MRLARSERGNTLIGMLVVVAIIAIMAAVFIGGGGGKGSPLSVGESQRADGKGRTVLGAAMASARDDVCRSNLQQIRAAITIATNTDEEKPASLADLRGMSSVSSCPIGKEPYEYDPTTGTVKCPHPGHGKY